ncbi:hypothetical protein ES703_105910 [subsurface metagenome]
MNTPHPQTTLFEDQKPVRVTVPVRPDVLAAFQRLAAAQGVSTGKAMGEWLADTLEGVEAMAGLLEKARATPKLAVQEIHSYALGLTDLTSELLQQVKGRVPADGAGKRELRALADGTRTLTPPVSNTGGKVPKKPKKGG